MKKQEALTVRYPGFFETEQRGHTIFLRFSGNFFHNSISFDKKEFFTDYLGTLDDAGEIRSVILHSAYSETGKDEYLHFFLRERSKRPMRHFGFSDGMEQQELNRYCNFINEFILGMIRLDKFIIHICGGDLFSQVINIMLACDHRIISRDTVFHNIFQTIGTIPKGGGIYLMEKMLGHSRTKDLLLLHPTITARQALDAGLADRIVEVGDLETAALEAAETIANIPRAVVSGIKRLTELPLRAFENHLDRETTMIARMGVTSYGGYREKRKG